MDMRQMIAFLMPLAYYEFLHEIGIAPWCSKYILLLKRITCQFAKYAAIYIGLVVVCSFSFTVMLPRTKGQEFPENFVEAIPYVIVQFTGEVSKPTFSNDAYAAQFIFFLGFVFFIVIILMNLLNALAVADASQMLQDADTEMLINLLSTVSYWEKISTDGKDLKLKPPKMVKFLVCKILSIFRKCFNFPDTSLLSRTHRLCFKGHKKTYRFRRPLVSDIWNFFRSMITCTPGHLYGGWIVDDDENEELWIEQEIIDSAMAIVRGQREEISQVEHNESRKYFCPQCQCSHCRQITAADHQFAHTVDERKS